MTMNDIEQKLIEGMADIEIRGYKQEYWLYIEGTKFGEFSTYTEALEFTIDLVNNLM